MASVISIPPPSFPCLGRRTHLKNLRKSPVFSFGEGQRNMTMVAKAVGENSDSSSSLSIVQSVQNAFLFAQTEPHSDLSRWDNSEDRIPLVGLGFAAVVAFWASTNLIGAIDKLPLIPSILEFIGILFSSWFIYRYLLFKPDREELGKAIKSSISDIIGQ